MKLEGLEKGTRVVTVSGDVAEVLEVAGDGQSARVRYVDVLSGGATEGSEASVYPEDVVTIDGDRFVGPGRTASSSR